MENQSNELTQTEKIIYIINELKNKTNSPEKQQEFEKLLQELIVKYDNELKNIK